MTELGGYGGTWRLCRRYSVELRIACRIALRSLWYMREVCLLPLQAFQKARLEHDDTVKSRSRREDAAQLDPMSTTALPGIQSANNYELLL